MKRKPHSLFISLCVLFVLGVAWTLRAETAWDKRLSDESGVQHQELAAQLATKRAWFAKVADQGQAFRNDSLILPSDRDPLDIALRRARALLDDLKKMPHAEKLAPMERELAAIQRQAEETAVQKRDARRGLFEIACKLRRRIAFANPVLDFDRIVFVKQQLPSTTHMCDQFFGCFSQPGGVCSCWTNRSIRPRRPAICWRLRRCPMGGCKGRSL